MADTTNPPGGAASAVQKPAPATPAEKPAAALSLSERLRKAVHVVKLFEALDAEGRELALKEISKVVG